MNCFHPRVDQRLIEGSHDGKLFYDLSMGRPELGPLPGDPDATIEVGRARAGSTVYFASFSRGVALDVFDPETGARTLAWSSDFWFSR